MSKLTIVEQNVSNISFINWSHRQGVKKKLIGMVSSFAHPHQGGVEVYSWELAKRMEQDGHQVIYISLNTEQQQSEELREGIYCFRLPCALLLGGKFPIPKLTKEYWSLLKKIKKLKYDLFFLNVRFYPLSLIFANLAKHRRIPALLVEHGTGHFMFSNFLLNRVGEFYEHAITACIKVKGIHFFGVSEACLKWLEHFNIHGCGTIYNGVNTKQLIGDSTVAEFGEKSDDELRVCFVGRLIEEKGISQLVEAVIALHGKYPSLQLLVAGDGPLKEKLPISSNFLQYLGKLPRDLVFQVFKACDVMVLPSRFPEGLPTTILEAGSQACAVITTSMGGTQEVITSEEFGVIIPDGSTDSIKAALSSLIENPKLRETMAKKLQERVRSEFDWDVIYQKFSKDVLDRLD